MQKNFKITKLIDDCNRWGLLKLNMRMEGNVECERKESWVYSEKVKENQFKKEFLEKK